MGCFGQHGHLRVYDFIALFLTGLSGMYCKVVSHLEAHAGFFRLLMKGIFDPYVLWPFDKKVDFLIINAH